MRDGSDPGLDVYLVEDVILTLCSLRGSLGWLVTDAAADPARRQAGIDRIERQLGQLEDRARSHCRTLARHPEPADPAPYVTASGLTLQRVLDDALGTDAPATDDGPVLFRTSRRGI